MSLIDTILNIAALLMWLSWRGVGASEPAGVPGTLLGNLRPATLEPVRRGRYLAGLVSLLVFRALFYRQVGPAVGWHGVWDTGVVSLAFRSDLFERMMLFSLLGFLWTLLGWYAWMVFLSVFNGPPNDRDPVSRQIRRHLRWTGRLPAPVQLLAPVVLLGFLWVGVGVYAGRVGLMPPVRDVGHLAQQALVVGLGAWIPWRWLLGGIYLLYLVNNYVYLGRHPFWEFIQHTGARLTRPFRWLRVGQVELGPVAGLAGVWILSSILGTGFGWLRGTVAGMPQWMESGLLSTLFHRLPWG